MSSLTRCGGFVNAERSQQDDGGTLYEIRWRTGPTTGPFLTQDDAVEYVLQQRGRGYEVSADLEITSPDADEDGLCAYREGEIREVGDDR